jgi:hypothetical protein
MGHPHPRLGSIPVETELTGALAFGGQECPPHTKNRNPHPRDLEGLFSQLGDGVEEGGEFGSVLGENLEELNAVADLGIGGDDLAEDEQRAFELQLEFERGADGERVHAFDVATAEAEVGGSAADRGFAAFGVNLDGNSHRESRMRAPLG